MRGFRAHDAADRADEHISQFYDGICCVGGLSRSITYCPNVGSGARGSSVWLTPGQVGSIDAELGSRKSSLSRFDRVPTSILSESQRMT